MHAAMQVPFPADSLIDVIRWDEKAGLRRVSCCHLLYARYNTVRTLQWANIDFANRCLKFGKDKTKAGTGRTVPLNQRALETVKLWAQQFPNRLSEHYVFPMEKCSRSGAAESFGFSGAVVYDTDPSQPIGDIKEAWEGAKRRTRRHRPRCGDGVLMEKPAAVTYAMSATEKLQNCPSACSAFASMTCGIVR